MSSYVLKLLRVAELESYRAYDAKYLAPKLLVAKAAAEAKAAAKAAKYEAVEYKLAA